MLGRREDGLTSSLTSAAWHGWGGVQHVGTTSDGHVLQPHHHVLALSDLTMFLESQTPLHLLAPLHCF